MRVINAQTLVSLIRDKRPHVQIVYFATCCSHYPRVCSFAGHTQALADGYALYAEATGGDIAPVGLAWKDVVDAKTPPFPSNDLWHKDGSHPSLRGSYLAAAVLFARLFHNSPVDNFFLGGLSETDASFLQKIASRYIRRCR